MLALLRAHTHTLSPSPFSSHMHTRTTHTRIRTRTHTHAHAHTLDMITRISLHMCYSTVYTHESTYIHSPICIQIGCLDQMLEYNESAGSRTDREIVAVLIIGINGLAAFLFPVYRAYIAVSNSKIRFSTMCTRCVCACMFLFSAQTLWCMHACMHVCTYVYMYMYVHAHKHARTRVTISHICSSTAAYMHTYICMHLYAYLGAHTDKRTAVSRRHGPCAVAVSKTGLKNMLRP